MLAVAEAARREGLGGRAARAGGESGPADGGQGLRRYVYAAGEGGVGVVLIRFPAGARRVLSSEVLEGVVRSLASRPALPVLSRCRARPRAGQSDSLGRGPLLRPEAWTRPEADPARSPSDGPGRSHRQAAVRGPAGDSARRIGPRLTRSCARLTLDIRRGSVARAAGPGNLGGQPKVPFRTRRRESAPGSRDVAPAA